MSIDVASLILSISRNLHPQIPKINNFAYFLRSNTQGRKCLLDFKMTHLVKMGRRAPMMSILKTSKVTVTPAKNRILLVALPDQLIPGTDLPFIKDLRHFFRSFGVTCSFEIHLMCKVNTINFIKQRNYFRENYTRCILLHKHI